MTAATAMVPAERAWRRDEGHGRDRLHPGGGPRLLWPARRHPAQRPSGRGDDQAGRRQHQHAPARGTAEELDELRRPGPGDVHAADDGGGGQYGARMTDTVFAPATAAGRAAVAVIRISGPASSNILQQLAAPLPAARRAALRRLKARDGSA